MNHRILFILTLLSASIVHAQSFSFELQESKRCGIGFNNVISENETINILNYDYLYNGAGVGVLDVNNDGLQDLYFCGNMVEDELYLNEGDFKFKNISGSIAGKKEGWSSGVLIFDVNNDGWDDIYVLRSGPDSSSLGNVLYVNQQDGSFEEDAESYGLNLRGNFTHAALLDIDLDDDIDLYLINHPANFNHKTQLNDLRANIESGKIVSDVLLENIGGKFVDVTKQSGILEFGYSLGIAISDINLDGYPDIFVSNDFDEPDHLFINQQNNTFKDEAINYFKHTSNYSMGSDIADINNDGLMDYVSVDMAFQDHIRSKMNMGSMDLTKFYTRVSLGWGYQYMHNMLQLNTGKGSFQEIAQFAGIDKSDWSWGPLLADFNQDGLVDLFITNGYKRDTKNNDIQLKLDSLQEKKGTVTIQEFLALIPSTKIPNSFFVNTNGLQFKSVASEIGLHQKVNSNGGAYVDLDNDGDLDIVTNNVDQVASVYKNVNEFNGNYVCLALDKMYQAQFLGKRIVVKTNKRTYHKELYWSRGYASSVDQRLFFYFEKGEDLEYILVGNQELKDIELNAISKIHPNKLTAIKIVEEEAFQPIFEDITEASRLDAIYLDNKFNDFTNESLLPHQLSAQGPEIAVGDFDKNGFEDFIVTSAVGKIPQVYLQSSRGTFKSILSRSFYNHHATEDGDVEVLDVNGDNNLDLIISSGGYEYAQGDTNYQNRLYIGNGIGMFGYVKNALPVEGLQSGDVELNDIDQDGDLDLLVCGNVHPGKYPYAGRTKIYRNTKGFFRDATQMIAPQIEYAGMVNDAVFTDLDNDGDDDLILVGEWMDIQIYSNNGGQFRKLDSDLNLKGWWSCVKSADVDGDGDMDLLVGNAGMNNKFNATAEQPVQVFANDFDDNGTLDIVLAKPSKNALLPVRGKECSSGQMPFLNQKFPSFGAFANSDLEAIYGADKLKQALSYEAKEFRSGWIENKGKFELIFHPFPAQAQFSFINDFEVLDVNGDQQLDVVAVGNRYEAEVETTRHDANVGIVLIQNENKEFEYIQPWQSGFYTPYNAKSSCTIELANGKTGILIGNNNQKVQLFQLNQ